jgi:formylglycine-generating enzyme required for sulfatase activity
VKGNKLTLMAVMATTVVGMITLFAVWRRPVMPAAAELARQRAATPAGMVFVPAGYFWMGTNDADADEDARPRRRVFLPSFYIDKLEVTNAPYKRFRPQHTFPQGQENIPVANLQWDEANAYAHWRGGHIPTDAEWEKAARGTDGRRYPWGNELTPDRANYRRDGQPGHPKEAAQTCMVPGAHKGLKAVGQYPTGASPYGALDMAGNAWEWVADFYRGDPDRRIIRGGAHGYGEHALRTYARGIEGAGVT